MEHYEESDESMEDGCRSKEIVKDNNCSERKSLILEENLLH